MSYRGGGEDEDLCDRYELVDTGGNSICIRKVIFSIWSEGPASDTAGGCLAKSRQKTQL